MSDIINMLLHEIKNIMIQFKFLPIKPFIFIKLYSEVTNNFLGNINSLLELKREKSKNVT